jgi:hypothetical protein
MLNFGALLCGGTLKMNAYFVHTWMPSLGVMGMLLTSKVWF